MSESLHPHEKPGKTDGAEPMSFEQLDPSKVERYELLEQFLSQCRDPSLRGSEQVADFIVSTLGSGPDQPWGYQLHLLKADVIDFDEDYLEDKLQHDEIFARIYGLILITKPRVGYKEGVNIERKALLELLDLRAGVTTRFDQNRLTNERNESGWDEVLNKIVPPVRS